MFRVRGGSNNNFANVGYLEDGEALFYRGPDAANQRNVQKLQQQELAAEARWQRQRRRLLEQGGLFAQRYGVILTSVPAAVRVHFMSDISCPTLHVYIDFMSISARTIF